MEPSKIRFSCETSCNFCDFATFSSNRVRTSIRHPPGELFGPPGALKLVLDAPSGRPKADSYCFLAVQNCLFLLRRASGSLRRGFQEAKGRPNRFLTRPGSLQEPFWLHFGPHLGSIFEHFLNNFGAILKQRTPQKAGHSAEQNAEQSRMQSSVRSRMQIRMQCRMQSGI